MNGPVSCLLFESLQLSIATRTPGVYLFLAARNEKAGSSAALPFYPQFPTSYNRILSDAFAMPQVACGRCR